MARKKNAVYLDLELDSDRLKVERDPEDFFELNRGKLVCLDEVQWLPEVFRTLRGIVDRSGKNGQFLVLGSASRDLIRQRGETLAGRISYLEISPFLWSETGGKTGFEDHWVRGGYPKSVLGGSDRLSLEWREDYIRSFLERDLALLDKRISSTVLRRFWSMLAHSPRPGPQPGQTRGFAGGHRAHGQALYRHSGADLHGSGPAPVVLER